MHESERVIKNASSELLCKTSIFLMVRSEAYRRHDMLLAALAKFTNVWDHIK